MARMFQLFFAAGAQGEGKESRLIVSRPLMLATDHWKDRGASSSCYSPLSRPLT